MLKSAVFLALALGFSLPAAAEIIDNYQGNGCRYEGAVGKDGKPEGRGSWRCADGRSYSGQFKKGRFDGKGVYGAHVTRQMFLAPFNINSINLKNMDLEGRFENGLAQGTFKVFQDGEQRFVMKFERGMLQEVTLPK
ncbi:MAG: hypothetical protein Q4G28_00945 [Neisseria sp.]|nr:hypothetical protein [Neisseria sp.]